MSVWMVDYFYNRVQNVIAKYTIERHWTSLNEETGGMNDALYRLYSITVSLARLSNEPFMYTENIHLRCTVFCRVIRST